MRRLLALFLLSLPLISNAQGDERAFRHAVEEWESLYRPLETANPVASEPLFARIIRDADARNQAVLRTMDHRRDWPKLLEALERNVQRLEASYDRADPRGRRALMRLFAVLGDLFGDGATPRYPTCGNGSEGDLSDRARELFGKRVRQDPASALGLLNDSDPRVAEISFVFLREYYPEEAKSRLLAWYRSPNPRFRGIVVVAYERLDGVSSPQEMRPILLALLDDEAKDIRETAGDNLEEDDVEAAFLARKAGYGSATLARKESALHLGTRLKSPDVVPLALSSLTGNASLTKKALDTLWRMDAPVPKPDLLRLFNHASVDIREMAYEQAGRQSIPLRDVRAGVNDPDEHVRRAALDAACRGATEPDEIPFLVEQTQKMDMAHSLHYAGARLGSRAVPKVLALLAHSDASMREAGIQLGCKIKEKKIYAAYERMVDDPSATIRLSVAGIAQALPKEVARRILQRLATDADPKVKEDAARTLEYLDEP